MSVDFGKTSNDYATHRAGFPESYYLWLTRYGVDVQGKRVIDLGTGTGTLARGFAQRHAVVTGVDPSAAMLEQARRLALAEHVSVEFTSGTAEALPFSDNSVDIVCAGQCWHWFDRAKAAAESRRVLKPNGLIIIAHFDWIPFPDNVVAATEELIRTHNPTWNLHGGTGIHPHWFADLSHAGFVNLLSHSHDELVPYSHQAWRGRIRAGAGIGASLSPEAVMRFDSEHAQLLQTRFPVEPLHIHHRVFFLLAHVPASHPQAYSDNLSR